MEKFKKSAETVLRNMIELIQISLSELVEIIDNPSTQFEYGEKTAYVECLEIIQEWEQAANCGLDYNIEKRFPLLREV